MITLGLDTSNYTTSAAAFDGAAGENFSRLLDVKPGELGLRQSDALFSHVKRLPELTEAMFQRFRGETVAAIGVSTRPRAVEGSYMPCFLAGESQAAVLSSALNVPLLRFSHQQGHIAAALFSAGRMDLLGQRFLSWHLSGGTTELLLVEGEELTATRLGGTTDLSAGQIIDRTGKTLGLQFPAGKELDALSEDAAGTAYFPVKCAELQFSFSGLQNKMEAFYGAGASRAETASYVLRSVASAVVRVTREAQRRYPGLPVVFSGGVASNRLLRQECGEFSPVFAAPRFSTDNAMGIAVLAWRQGEKIWNR